MWADVACAGREPHEGFIGAVTHAQLVQDNNFHGILSIAPMTAMPFADGSAGVVPASSPVSH